MLALGEIEYERIIEKSVGVLKRRCLPCEVLSQRRSDLVVVFIDVECLYTVLVNGVGILLVYPALGQNNTVGCRIRALAVDKEGKLDVVRHARKRIVGYLYVVYTLFLDREGIFNIAYLARPNISLDSFDRVYVAFVFIALGYEVDAVDDYLCIRSRVILVSCVVGAVCICAVQLINNLSRSFLDLTVVRFGLID